MPPNKMQSTTLVGKKMAAPGHAPDEKNAMEDISSDIARETRDHDIGSRPVGSARA